MRKREEPRRLSRRRSSGVPELLRLDSLLGSTPSMRKREEPRRLSRRRSSGTPSSSRRLQLEHRTCCTRTPATGRAKKTIKAQKLWYAIIESQIETGTPYMLYKDSCNRKSNQQKLWYAIIESQIETGTP